MAKVGKSGLPLMDSDFPRMRREMFLDLAARREEVLVAKSVVEEVKKRVRQFRSETKVAREKDKATPDTKVTKVKDKAKDEKVEEKARAAAWAWYEHGKGGKESISAQADPAGGPSTGSGRVLAISGSSPHKTSRFRTEALKGSRQSGDSVDPSQNWDFQIASAQSSLFDTYELDSVSRRIDKAFQAESSTMAAPAAPAPAKERSQDAPTPTTTEGSTIRLQFPGNICGSVEDVVNHQDMALGLDIHKCECHKGRLSRSSDWSFRKFSRLMQVLMRLPDCHYHPQQRHPERRQAQELFHEHHHRHEHDHHHHIHYRVKLREGTYNG